MIKYKKFIKLKHSDIQLKSKVIENYLTKGPLPKDPARVFKQILYDLQENGNPEKSMRAVADLFEARKDIELRCVDSSWDKLKNKDDRSKNEKIYRQNIADEVAKQLSVKTDRQFVRNVLREKRSAQLEKKLNKPI